jgi:hypothetical protein
MHLPFTSSGSRKSTRKVPRGSAMGLICLVSAFSLIGCEKSPTGPEPIKDPRTYTWTIDTLAYPGSFQTTMRDIWGSSPRDVYVVGHNDQAFGLMWHFDGKVWSPVSTPFGLIDLSAIYGFAANEIWVVGEHLFPNPNPPPNFLDSSLVIRFDGTTWREIIVHGGRNLQAVWGRSASEVWIGGWMGFLAQYNGSQFTRDSLPYTFGEEVYRGLLQIVQITGSASETHLVLANAPDSLFQLPIFYFYERVRSRWDVRDSTYDFARILLAPQGKLYRYGPFGVQQRTGTSWQTVLDIPIVGMAASSEGNIFAAGFAGPSLHGRLYHYNGTDWFEYMQLRMDGVEFKRVWTDGKEAFLIGTTSGIPMKTVVLHGR